MERLRPMDPWIENCAGNWADGLRKGDSSSVGRAGYLRDSFPNVVVAVRAIRINTRLQELRHHYPIKLIFACFVRISQVSGTACTKRTLSLTAIIREVINCNVTLLCAEALIHRPENRSPVLIHRPENRSPVLIRDLRLPAPAHHYKTPSSPCWPPKLPTTMVPAQTSRRDRADIPQPGVGPLASHTTRQAPPTHRVTSQSPQPAARATPPQCS